MFYPLFFIDKLEKENIALGAITQEDRLTQIGIVGIVYEIGPQTINAGAVHGQFVSSPCGLMSPYCQLSRRVKDI